MSELSPAGPRELQRRLVEAAPGLLRRPLQADPVAAAVCAIARHHGLEADPLSIAAGLPLVDGCLTLQLLTALAERAGLVCESLVSPQSSLKPSHCPALAVLSDGTLRTIARCSSAGDLTLAPVSAGDPGQLIVRRDVGQTLQQVLLLRPASTDDHAEGTSVGALVSRELWRSNARIYGQALVATTIINILAVIIPLYTMNVYDRVLPNNALTTLIALSIGVALAGLCDFAMKSARGLLIDIASRRTDLVISMKVFARLLGAKLTPQASLVGVRANTMREIETIREFNTSVTLAALGDLPFALLFLVVIAVVGGPLVWVPIIAMPIVIGLVLALQGPIDRMTEASMQHMANKNGVLVETLTGMETIKGLGAESWAATRWEKAVADQLRLSTMMRFCSGLGLGIVGFGQIASTIAMIVLGVMLVGDGSITAGALMASMMLMSRAMQPVGQVAALAGKLHSVRIARKSLQGVMQATQERPADARLMAPAVLRGAVAFDGVSLSYGEGTQPALAEVSFNVEPGEHVGILGAIGSGKSSLLRLAAKLHDPSSGRILIDSLALPSLDPAALRARIGYLSQDATLFQGSIRENLKVHRPRASDAEIIAAAEQSGAMTWITRLGQGFDARIGERGHGLSGGQKRSLALARALVGEPRLLLLDEPTSEMDGRSEQLVVERLRRWLPGRTLLLVTHKPATLDLVNRLIVIDQGRIMTDGPKAAVLAELQRQSAERRSDRALTAGASL